MNWKHFVALVKLRYQLSRNQVKKAGKLNAVLSMIFLAFGVLCSVSSFLVGAIGGAFWFQSASPNTIFVTWNVIVIAFLAIWTIGVLMELQQTELMSIDKLLHLPVSLQGAFFLNYTSSFINSAFLLFVPMMIGVSIGMSIARGPTMLIAIPLVVGFLFMVTTLTYQLQGWLSRLMENKRTRGTVIVVVTISFILLTQVPNLVSSTINESSSDKRKRRNAEREVLQEKAREEVLASIVAGEATEEEKPGLMEAAAAVAKKAYAANRKKERAAKFASIVDFVKKLDVYAPPGWLPLGILRAAERKWTTGVVGSLAMFAIGFISLTFSYRSSMRRYLGVGAKPRKRKPVDGSELLKESESLKGAAEFMFRRIPFVNENVSAVAVAGFRGLMRAPETKMIMVFPFIMGMLACSFLVGKSDFNIPELLRPWIPIGVIGMIMFSITSMLFNQFGVDRDGFRAFMISPIRRRDILLGKNLAIVPIAFGLCGFLLVALQIFLPAGVLLFVGTLLQVPAIYLLYCMLGNVASIFFPMGIKRGSMQPANPRFIPMLILVLGSILGPSLLLVPTTIVCGVTTLAVVTLELSAGWIFLLLTAFQLVGTWYAYLWLLDLADGWLWDRGPKILDVVSNIPE